MSQTPVCAITVLDTLKEEIEKDKWINVTAQKRVMAGVDLAKQRLIKAGFIKVNQDELPITPIQLELPLEHDSIWSEK